MIKINYTLSVHREVPPHRVYEMMTSVQKQVCDMPVKAVSEVHASMLPQTDIYTFGGTAYNPDIKTGFRCSFWENTSEMQIQLCKFPEEGACPRHWAYSNSFWTLSGLKDDQFISRHRTAVKILDALKNAGLGVLAEDESGFYLDRNLASLLEFKQVIDRANDPRDSIVR